jgi:hypothetical protein
MLATFYGMSVGSRNVDRVSASGHAYHSQWTPLLRIPIVDGSQVARATSSWAGSLRRLYRKAVCNKRPGSRLVSTRIQKSVSLSGKTRPRQTVTTQLDLVRIVALDQPHVRKPSSSSPPCRRAVFSEATVICSCAKSAAATLCPRVWVSSASPSFGRGCPAFGPGMRWVLFERAAISIRGVW